MRWRSLAALVLGLAGACGSRSDGGTGADASPGAGVSCWTSYVVYSACLCKVGVYPPDNSIGYARSDCGKAGGEGNICCASPGWPAVGDCSCGTFACSQGATDCRCGYGLAPGGASVCTGTYCCANDDVCSCSDTPCGGSAKRVPQCDTTIFRCGDMREVDACR
jgi:hypothetical protein